MSSKRLNTTTNSNSKKPKVHEYKYESLRNIIDPSSDNTPAEEYLLTYLNRTLSRMQWTELVRAMISGDLLTSTKRKAYLREYMESIRKPIDSTELYKTVVVGMNPIKKIQLDILMRNTQLQMLHAINEGFDFNETKLVKPRFEGLEDLRLDEVDGGSRKGRKYHNKPMRNLTKKI
jgi:hypothetical protein